MAFQKRWNAWSAFGKICLFLKAKTGFRAFETVTMSASTILTARNNQNLHTTFTHTTYQYHSQTIKENSYTGMIPVNKAHCAASARVSRRQHVPGREGECPRRSGCHGGWRSSTLKLIVAAQVTVGSFWEACADDVKAACAPTLIAKQEVLGLSFSRHAL